MGISDVARYSMTLLFSRNAKEISDLKASMIDMRASLVCDLSETNKTISEAIELNARLICNEYADFLLNTISKLNGTKFDYSKAKPLVEFVNYTSNLSEDMDDDLIASELKFSNKKIQDIIGYDIAKATAMQPIVQGKSNEFIESIRERLAEITNKSVRIRNFIDECIKIIESCDFCIWYLSKTNTKAHEHPSLLEKDYDTIISSLCAEYIKWKESDQR